MLTPCVVLAYGGHENERGYLREHLNDNALVPSGAGADLKSSQQEVFDVGYTYDNLNLVVCLVL